MSKVLGVILVVCVSILRASHHPILSKQENLPEIHASVHLPLLTEKVYTDQALLLASAANPTAWELNFELKYCLPKLFKALSHVEDYLETSKHCKRFEVFVELMDVSKEISLIEYAEEVIEKDACPSEYITLVASMRSIILKLVRILFRLPVTVPVIPVTVDTVVVGMIAEGEMPSTSADKLNNVDTFQSPAYIQNRTRLYQSVLFSVIDDLYQLADKRGLFDFVTSLERILAEAGECGDLGCQRRIDQLCEFDMVTTQQQAYNL